MKDIRKYQGVIPAFYACYDENGAVSAEGAKALTRHLISKGVKGVYVGGSSGECIYHFGAADIYYLQSPDAPLGTVPFPGQNNLSLYAHCGRNKEPVR